MKKGLIVLGVLVLLVVIFAGSFIGRYNRIVTLNENIAGEWSQVESQLQRRNDLVPNLVNTVKGYAAHEKEVFQSIAEARSKLAGARTVDEKVRANEQMDSALARLLVIVEQYPNLKANENFIRLQDELAGTENRIAVERQRYNGSVLSYNTAIKTFPGNVIASMTGFSPRDAYFKAEEGAKQAPKVEF